ncbi:MAG TPA: SAM-dependent methyltransferase [Microbacteriaceae bacterium]|nr:SAM-dependent methyltransferase [Microbacteriaceae bacterium]
MERTELLQVLSPEALKMLDELPPYGGLDILRTEERLRAAGHDAAQVAAVLTQARLRAKAEAKLGAFARRMLFTEAGLQQATRLRVAALHAGRFHAAGLRRVADLGCGIGADALALAGLGLQVAAIEADEATAALAAYNLAPFPNARVVHDRAEDADLSDREGVWLDPARRTTGRHPRRLRDPAAFSPPLDFALGLAARLPAGVKLGPGVERGVIPDDVEAQWVSVAGEVVEMTLWSRQLARQGVRRAALVLHDNGADELTAEGDAPDVASAALGDYLYEPDGAVIRARQIGPLADRLGARMLAPHIAYLTSDRAVSTPFANCFRVAETLPFSVRQLTKALRARGIGSLEIKKRGVDLDPAALRRALRLHGPNEATLILTRDRDGDHLAVLAHRMRA